MVVGSLIPLDHQAVKGNERAVRMMERAFGPKSSFRTFGVHYFLIQRFTRHGAFGENVYRSNGRDSPEFIYCGMADIVGHTTYNCTLGAKMELVARLRRKLTIKEHLADSQFGFRLSPKTALRALDRIVHDVRTVRQLCALVSVNIKNIFNRVRTEIVKVLGLCYDVLKLEKSPSRVECRSDPMLPPWFQNVL
ncbi:hypothetical protein HHI36_020112 [Cryptolaemus montrouzieri]|uniref:Uncharacterized protein n=1 Tax=Cryptolaemus montrouzieri TaxID=559131 RepID=A0ABD2NAC2_9CUCU